MDYGRIVCPYCKAEVPRSAAVQYTCGRQKCRAARQKELKEAENRGFAPGNSFSALGVEILVDLMERRGLSEREAASAMNRDYQAVRQKVAELKETGAYGVVLKKIQMMRRLKEAGRKPG